MQMPMQIGLDELLSMVMARMEGMAMAEESLKTKFNVLARALYRKGLLTDEDVVEALREEYRILKELGVTGEVPGEDMIKAVAENILQWVRGDVPAIRQGMEDYEKKVRELSAQEARKPRIDVASPALLSQLDRATGKAPRGGSKLII
ncbi:MAG: hypothetical protein BWY88_00510 [Synergistetes bacterium ADurb.Bin520]|jgi:hypothetical protein|nr:MAG: hypothetical protein BWY88_00510 [Synergistetes bacterium ADurb.Bin520]